jgi:hypothetical protein
MKVKHETAPHPISERRVKMHMTSRQLEAVLDFVDGSEFLIEYGTPVTNPDAPGETLKTVRVQRLEDNALVYITKNGGIHHIGSGQVFIVIGRYRSTDGVAEVEVLDKMPLWDWVAQNQIVLVGNVNGGDSAPVPMPEENRGR